MTYIFFIELFTLFCYGALKNSKFVTSSCKSASSFAVLPISCSASLSKIMNLVESVVSDTSICILYLLSFPKLLGRDISIYFDIYVCELNIICCLPWHAEFRFRLTTFTPKNSFFKLNLRLACYTTNIIPAILVVYSFNFA